ncbi:MAG: 16S rRNA (cytosine(1402)-N(4))-methyltransferase RsmH [Chloroflexi bacterium]|nr:16S rRNA (cytosine(1402)-N(4))-methyltransferase RsmH [Chloroflexota bacterium]
MRRYLDGTLGLGGHTEAIALVGGTVLGLDADPDALALAAERLRPFGERVRLMNANFRDLAAVAQREGFAPLDGVLLDLGVSSLQFSAAGRGFTIQANQPLDMRFDPRQPETAADLVNTLPETELARIIWEYGEERHSRRIARTLVQRRPVATTGDLVRAVTAAAGPHTGGIHPATRTFQALRIAVNDELAALTSALRQAVDILRPGGRLVVISFHSLEDRIVKTVFRDEAATCVCPPSAPVCVCRRTPRLSLITKKPITPSAAEAAANPRSRSAKLRIAERRVQP